jgi:hypothetical protein
MRHRPWKPGAGRRTAALALTALAVAVGGCGSSSPSRNGVAGETPAEIVAAARAAAAGAATVHVSGSILSAGKPISLNMELVSGKGGSGQIDVEGMTVDLIALEKAVYVNGDQGLYTRVVGPAAARVLQGRWLKVPASSASFTPLASVTDLQSLIDTTLDDHGPLVAAPGSTVDGQSAVAVTDPARGGTLYVATTGVPYPLEIAKPATGGRIVFDRWNQPVTIQPPANPISIKQLSRRR